MSGSEASSVSFLDLDAIFDQKPQQTKSVGEQLIELAPPNPSMTIAEVNDLMKVVTDFAGNDPKKAGLLMDVAMLYFVCPRAEYWQDAQKLRNLLSRQLRRNYSEMSARQAFSQLGIEVNYAGKMGDEQVMVVEGVCNAPMVVKGAHMKAVQYAAQTVAVEEQLAINGQVCMPSLPHECGVDLPGLTCKVISNLADIRENMDDLVLDLRNSYAMRGGKPVPIKDFAAGLVARLKGKLPGATLIIPGGCRVEGTIKGEKCEVLFKDSSEVRFEDLMDRFRGMAGSNPARTVTAIDLPRQHNSPETPVISGAEISPEDIALLGKVADYLGNTNRNISQEKSLQVLNAIPLPRAKCEQLKTYLVPKIASEKGLSLDGIWELADGLGVDQDQTQSDRYRLILRYVVSREFVYRCYDKETKRFLGEYADQATVLKKRSV